MYCKNCGSILQQNANFCHVCGTKVEIDDIFDTPKEEVKQEEPKQEVFDDYYNYNKEEVKEEKQTEYRDYFAAGETSKEPVRRRKPFLPGLFSMIITIVLGINSASTWLLNILYLNTLYNSGSMNYNEYMENVSSALLKIIVYLFLGVAAGLTLGIAGFKVGKEQKSTPAKVFSIIGISLAGIEFIVLVALIILNVTLV